MAVDSPGSQTSEQETIVVFFVGKLRLKYIYSGSYGYLGNLKKVHKYRTVSLLNNLQPLLNSIISAVLLTQCIQLLLLRY